jgi:hypothetical protein
MTRVLIILAAAVAVANSAQTAFASSSVSELMIVKRGDAASPTLMSEASGREGSPR